MASSSSSSNNDNGNGNKNMMDALLFIALFVLWLILGLLMCSEC